MASNRKGKYPSPPPSKQVAQEVVTPACAAINRAYAFLRSIGETVTWDVYTYDGDTLRAHPTSTQFSKAASAHVDGKVMVFDPSAPLDDIQTFFTVLSNLVRVGHEILMLREEKERHIAMLCDQLGDAIDQTRSAAAIAVPVLSHHERRR